MVEHWLPFRTYNFENSNLWNEIKKKLTKPRKKDYMEVSDKVDCKKITG
jgi:hypothetical protein